MRFYPKVLKRHKPVSGVEIFVVLAVRTFYFAVVPWCNSTFHRKF